MGNREVNLTKRVRTPQGPRFCPVVLSANGRVRPDWVVVNGKPERHPEGSYYLYWHQGRKQFRRAVGTDAAHAAAQRIRKENELVARASGIRVVSEDNDKRRTLADCITEYLDEIRITHTPATHAAYNLALRDFANSYSKIHIEDIERSDLLHYIHYSRKELRLADRTIHNRFEHVVTFLKAYGVEKLTRRGDWPKFVHEKPEAYRDDELEKFFAACDDEERDYFTFYLMTGLRRKEVIYCTWDDIDLKAGIVRVSAKAQYGFKPKDWEERDVPIPDALIRILKQRAKHATSPFVFATKNGTPRKHRTQVLELCKAVARRAGLNPENFWLHKFRASFATRHLQKGVDLRTVQDWLGHKDLESTMRYLQPAKGKAVRQKVNATFSAVAGGVR